MIISFLKEKNIPKKLFKACLFAASILNFFTITAASESAVTAWSPVSLEARCKSVLMNNPAYLDPTYKDPHRVVVREHPGYLDSQLDEFEEEKMSETDIQMRLNKLDGLRVEWCLQKVGTMRPMRFEELGGSTSIACNPDGSQFATGSWDRIIRIRNLNDGAQLRLLTGHTDWVMAVAYNHDGTRLASGSNDKTIRIWNPTSGVCLLVLAGHTGWVRSVAYNHDGTRLASGSNDKTVGIWDSIDGRSLHVLEGHANWVESIAYNNDGTQLASGSGDKTILLWNPIDGVQLHLLAGHTQGVKSVAYNHDDTQLASASLDGTIRIWNPIDGACTRMLKEPASFELESADEIIQIFNLHSCSYLLMFKEYADLNESRAYNRDKTQLAITFVESVAVQLVLQKIHFEPLSYEERLGLFKALLTNTSNEHCAAVAEKLTGLKMMKLFKSPCDEKNVASSSSLSSSSGCAQ